MSSQPPDPRRTAAKRAFDERDPSPLAACRPSSAFQPPAPVAHPLSLLPPEDLVRAESITPSAVEAQSQSQLRDIAAREQERFRKRLRLSSSAWGNSRAGSVESVGSSDTNVGAARSGSASPSGIHARHHSKLDRYTTRVAALYKCIYHPENHRMHSASTPTYRGPILSGADGIPNNCPCSCQEDSNVRPSQEM